MNKKRSDDLWIQSCYLLSAYGRFEIPVRKHLMTLRAAEIEVG